MLIVPGAGSSWHFATAVCLVELLVEISYTYINS